MGLLFPIYGKIKNVPNHQPADVLHWFTCRNSWKNSFVSTKRHANSVQKLLALMNAGAQARLWPYAFDHFLGGRPLPNADVEMKPISVVSEKKLAAVCMCGVSGQKF
jgi:hypothetical protein